MYNCYLTCPRGLEEIAQGDIAPFAKFIETKTTQEAIELATACATLKCTRIGGIKTLPNNKENEWNLVTTKKNHLLNSRLFKINN